MKPPRRPDAWEVAVWRHPDTDEPDLATYDLQADADPEAERLEAVTDAVQFMTTVPHRVTSRGVYYGKPKVHRLEVRTKAEALSQGDA